MLIRRLNDSGQVDRGYSIVQYGFRMFIHVISTLDQAEAVVAALSSRQTSFGARRAGQIPKAS